MRSGNGGKHGLAGWGFRGFPETGVRLWADDGANPVSLAGSSLVAANLRLAELRSVSQISGIVQVSFVLATEARWPSVFGPGGAFQLGEARRDQGCRWGFSIELGAADRVVFAGYRAYI